jgi:hypothetical protein
MRLQFGQNIIENSAAVTADSITTMSKLIRKLY